MGKNQSHTQAGATYTRWGKKSCPSTSSIIYSGQMASPDLLSAGGGSNYLCLPTQPSYHTNSIEANQCSYISRVWYSLESVRQQTREQTALRYHTVPCTVCETEKQLTSLMIPAMSQCPNSDWTLEYSGYLMSSPTHYHPSDPYHKPGSPRNKNFRTNYACVDENYESYDNIASSAKSFSGSPLYFVQAECRQTSGSGSLLRCPPFSTKKALACVVCSK